MNTDKEEDRMEKELFLSNMTHEIKTPLNGIVGYIQLLLQTELTIAQKNYVNNMSCCSLQLMRIINDILDYSKLSSHKMPLMKSVFSLQSLFRDIEKTLGTQVRGKRQKLFCRLLDSHEPLSSTTREVWREDRVGSGQSWVPAEELGHQIGSSRFQPQTAASGGRLPPEIPEDVQYPSGYKRAKDLPSPSAQTIHHVVADRQKVMQVLINLLTNASKFSPQGASIRVEARLLVLREEEADRETEEGSLVGHAEGQPVHREPSFALLLTVQDEGCGLASSLGSEEKSFNFSSAQYGSGKAGAPEGQSQYGVEEGPGHSSVQFQSMSHIRSGSGLGLAITKKLVELMGGKIRATGGSGEGTTFHILVPCNLPFPGRVASRVPRQASFPAEEGNGTEGKGGTQSPGAGRDRQVGGTETFHRLYSHEFLQNRRVLLVDDSAVNRIQVSQYFKDWGSDHLTVCASPMEGYNALRDASVPGRRHFDAVLLDICMPETSGVELASLMKEVDPAVPIIGLSSRDRVDKTNFSSVLTRPFHRLELLDRLRKCCGGRSLAGSHHHRSAPFPHPVPNPVSSMSVLLAEDNKHNQEIMVGLLRTLGVRDITVVENGQEVLEMMQSVHKSFSVLLLDLKMPVMSGFEVIRLFSGPLKEGEKKIDLPPGTSIVPVSAFDEGFVREFCQRYKVKNILSKPVQLRELDLVLRNL